MPKVRSDAERAYYVRLVDGGNPTHGAPPTVAWHERVLRTCNMKPLSTLHVLNHVREGGE